MLRSIRSLCLEIAGVPYRAIIVRPGDQVAAGPGDAQRTWLSVRAGDMILLGGRRERIRSVSLYEVSPESACDTPVTCGADWLAGSRGTLALAAGEAW